MGLKEKPDIKRKLAQIIEKYDQYSLRSREHLRTLIYTSIKAVFVGSLRAVETRLGDDFPQYSGLRAEILRIGNDAVREMHKYLNKFNVEMIPEVVEFLLEEGTRQGVKRDGQETVD
jgi:hypothetical protein